MVVATLYTCGIYHTVRIVSLIIKTTALIVTSNESDAYGNKSYTNVYQLYIHNITVVCPSLVFNLHIKSRQ